MGHSTEPMKYFIPLIMLCGWAVAQSVHDIHFMWDANPSSDGVTEYRIYEKVAQYQYELVVVVPATSKPSVVVAGVLADRVRYYVCRAYNGEESEDSQTFTLGTPQPTARGTRASFSGRVQLQGVSR